MVIEFFSFKMSLYTAKTENGAPAFASTENQLLDFHFRSVRNAVFDSEMIKTICNQTYVVNDRSISGVRALAQYLIYLRHFRGGFGKGERAVYFATLNQLLEDEEVRTWFFDNGVIEKIGSWKDYLYLSHRRAVVKKLKTQLMADQKAMENGEPVSLCAKWMPTEKSRKGASYYKQLAHSLYGQHPYQAYRQLITALRSAIDIPERKIAEKRFSEIDYSKIPTRCLKKYQKVFRTKDSERYLEYLQQIKNGEVKVKTTGLEVNELISKVNSMNDELYTQIFYEMVEKGQSSDSKILVMADVSGSMSGQPMNVSVGLALYMSAVNGKWLTRDEVTSLRDASPDVFRWLCSYPQATEFKMGGWWTFSQKPETVLNCSAYRIGEVTHPVSLLTMVRQMKKNGWEMNTNFEAAFEKFLNEKLNYDTLIVVSDMQFDGCVQNGSRSNLEVMRARFAQEGQKMPKIVFWNVRDCGNVPAKAGDNGVLMVSGFSTNVLNDLIRNDLNAVTTPVDSAKLLEEILAEVETHIDFTSFPL